TGPRGSRAHHAHADGRARRGAGRTQGNRPRVPLEVCNTDLRHRPRCCPSDLHRPERRTIAGHFLWPGQQGCRTVGGARCSCLYRSRRLQAPGVRPPRSRCDAGEGIEAASRPLSLPASTIIPASHLCFSTGNESSEDFCWGCTPRGARWPRPVARCTRAAATRSARQCCSVTSRRGTWPSGHGAPSAYAHVTAGTPWNLGGGGAVGPPEDDIGRHELGERSGRQAAVDAVTSGTVIGVWYSLPDVVASRRARGWIKVGLLLANGVVVAWATRINDDDNGGDIG